MESPVPRKPTKLPLAVPIVWAGETLRELTVQRATAAQLWDLKAGKDGTLSIGQVLAVAAKCCGLPEDAIRLLDAEDAIALVSIMGESLGSGLATGT